MTRRYQALCAGPYPYLVAEQNARSPVTPMPRLPRTPAYYWCIEDSIYVAPSFQRRGIGRALLVRLIVASETAGFRQMVAVIGDSANTGSIEVHRTAGFRMVGTFDNVGFKFGRWLDTVLMQRALGSGATEPAL